MGASRRPALVALLCLFLAAPAGGVDLPAPVLPPAPLGSTGGLWIPTFADEFDGRSVDASKWSSGFGWGPSADHAEAYCDPTGNVVRRGVLVQRAENRPLGGKPYSGACLHTRHVGGPRWRGP